MKKDNARSIRDDDDFYLSLECLEVENNLGIEDFEFTFFSQTGSLLTTSQQPIQAKKSSEKSQ